MLVYSKTKEAKSLVINRKRFLENELRDFKNSGLGLSVDNIYDKIVSFVKSGIRILGYMFIPWNIGVAVTLLVVSEAVGILEELV